MSEPEILNAEEAATYLRITPAALTRLSRQGRIGYVKSGRARTYPLAALRAYIEAHTVQPVENPYGLTDASLQRIREGRALRSGERKVAS